MIQVIDGRDGWKFIDVTAENFVEALELALCDLDKTLLFFDFSNMTEAFQAQMTQDRGLQNIKNFGVRADGDSLSILERFRGIEKLTFKVPVRRFDFSSLTSLQSLGGVWSYGFKNFDECKKLTDLSVSKYPGDISSLPNLRSLRVIRLIQPRLQSLSGVERALNAQVLDVSYASNLVDIDQIQSLLDNLNELSFQNCRKIHSYRFLGRLASVRKLMITDCAPLESLHFVEAMKSLRFISFVGTRVIDADLSPLLRNQALRYVGAMSNRGYRPSVQSIEMEMTSRVSGDRNDSN